MPSDWVYKSKNQKRMWLVESGFDPAELPEDFTVEVQHKEVA